MPESYGEVKKEFIPPPKKKLSIEEQMFACETEHELASFKLIAEMNPQLKSFYDNRYAYLMERNKEPA